MFSQMPPDLVGEKMETELFYDAVNVLLSLQVWFSSCSIIVFISFYNFCSITKCSFNILCSSIEHQWRFPCLGASKGSPLDRGEQVSLEKKTRFKISVLIELKLIILSVCCRNSIRQNSLKTLLLR